MKIIMLSFTNTQRGRFDNGKRFLKLVEYPQDDEARYLVANKTTLRRV